jgi:SpoIID/LytB domain protein
MYLGVTNESPASTAAVNATKGRVLLYGGKVATTFFYSTSGGQTESSADWTGTAVPYLVSVPDPYDTMSPYHDWGPVPVTATSLLKALKLAGPVMDVTTTPNQAGRVAQLKLTTPLHSLLVPASQLRTAIGLRSTWFMVGLLSLTQPQPVAPVQYGTKVSLASVVRGFSGVALEQNAGTGWTTVRTVNPGRAQLSAAPAATTDYRLATSTVSAGSVRIKVMPVVTLTAAASTQITGTITPVLSDVQIDVQQLNVDQTWTTVATGLTLADGTFSVPVGLAQGATIRVLATPATGYVPGASASQVVSG